MMFRTQEWTGWPGRRDRPHGRAG